MSGLKRYNYKLLLICTIFVFISFIASFILNENSLGGAFGDSKALEKYFFDLQIISNSLFLNMVLITMYVILQYFI